MLERPFVSWTRNVLVSCGALYVSFWLAPLFGSVTLRFTNRIIYGDGILDAVACGVMISLGSALAMILAGILVTWIISGKKSHFWAVLIGVLYAVDFHVHTSGQPPTAWDRTQLGAERFFPAIACVVAAFVAAWLRARRQPTVRRDG